MLNKVMLIGNVCADPDIRYMPSGDPIATMNIATNRRWKDKNGQKQEESEFHRVTFFGGQAKVCADYVRKGSKLYIEGRIKTDKYQKDGVDVYRTGIIGESLQMLDSRSSGQNNSNNVNRTEQKPQQHDNSAGFDDTDIPFFSLNSHIRNHLI